MDRRLSKKVSLLIRLKSLSSAGSPVRVKYHSYNKYPCYPKTGRPDTLAPLRCSGGRNPEQGNPWAGSFDEKSRQFFRKQIFILSLRHIFKK
jgi:hypothetical protein